MSGTPESVIYALKLLAKHRQKDSEAALSIFEAMPIDVSGDGEDKHATNVLKAKPLINLKRYGDALQALEIASQVEKKETDAFLHIFKGDAHLGLKNFAQALISYNTFFSMVGQSDLGDDAWASAHYGKARALSGLHQTEDANKFFQVALSFFQQSNLIRLREEWTEDEDIISREAFFRLTDRELGDIDMNLGRDGEAAEAFARADQHDA